DRGGEHARHRRRHRHPAVQRHRGSPPRPPTGTGRSAGSTGRCSRSEEHTSELQSLTNLVCRLLLEKKKKRQAGAPAPRDGYCPDIVGVNAAAIRPARRRGPAPAPGRPDRTPARPTHHAPPHAPHAARDALHDADLGGPSLAHCRALAARVFHRLPLLPRLDPVRGPGIMCRPGVSVASIVELVFFFFKDGPPPQYPPFSPPRPFPD